MEFYEQFLAAALRIGTPLLWAAMGELILERSGVLNIGIEGVMLVGAFCGFMAGWATGSPLVGCAAAMLAGALFGLVLAAMTQVLRADQIVVGMALNLVAYGVTGVFFRVFKSAMQKAGRGASLSAPTFGELLPSLREWPLIGPVLMTQTALTWLAFAAVPVVWWFLQKSERGLELRAVGENPAAAEASGIDVRRVRVWACVVAGMLGGLGGGFLTLSQTASFSPKITAGRGFVALAAVVLGRYGSWGTAAACLFFGAAFSARDRYGVGSWAIKPELLEILPYALTVLALTWALQKRTGAPAALGK